MKNTRVALPHIVEKIRQREGSLPINRSVVASLAEDIIGSQFELPFFHIANQVFSTKKKEEIIKDIISIGDTKDYNFLLLSDENNFVNIVLEDRVKVGMIEIAFETNSFNTNNSIGFFYDGMDSSFSKRFKSLLIEMGYLEEVLISSDDDEDPKVLVNFAYPARGGVDTINRDFTPIPFDTIKQNYNAQVTEQVTAVKKILETEVNGLVILHGPPGTGKTYLIRSLLSDTRNYRSGIICIPPTAFLSDSKLLVQSISRLNHPLVILEDVGALFQASTKESNVDIFSSLANLTDGLQSLLHGAIFILSFNNEIDDMDPALLRPGRCLGSINVPRLGYAESIQIVGEDNADKLSSSKEYTLAELYEISGKIEKISAPIIERKVGLTALWDEAKTTQTSHSGADIDHLNPQYR